MTETSPHVVIIGAGTGGLCLAQGLRQAGVSVAVYERDRTRTDGLFGYRVGIDPDGSRALAACLPADLFEVFVTTRAVTPRFFNIVTERGSELLRMGDWHTPEPADPTTAFPLQVRTTTPMRPWPSTTVTLIGDAVHTMTPGLGVGANTALRDARNLARRLISAHRGELSPVEAVAAYERDMHGYAWDLVARSKTQFGGALPLDKPVIGRVLLAVMRTGMRLFNRLPAAKRRWQNTMEDTRGHGRVTTAPEEHR